MTTPEARSPSAASPMSASLHEWSWVASLAAARPGQRYRVTRTLFSLVKERCRELGCADGAELTCDANGGGRVGFSTASGGQKWIERNFAWFVQVEPLSS